MTSRTLLAACTLGFALSLTATSFAQKGAEGGGKGGKKSDTPGQVTPERATGGGTVDPGLLAGPSVEQEAEDGRSNPMGGANGGNRPRAAATQPIPFRQWMETIRGVDISAQQQQKITAIITELQTANADFQAAHGEEMRRMQQQVRTSRESGKEPDPKMREQFQQLEALMPKQVDYQQRIWATLTTEQQDQARVKLAEIERRNAQQQQRRRAAGNTAPAAGNTGAAGGGSSGGNAPGEPRLGRNLDTPNQGGGEDIGDGMLPASGNGGRLERKSTTIGESDQMTGGAGVENPTGEPARAAPLRDRVRERARAVAGGIDMQRLDDAGRRRVDFLLSRQSAARPGHEPTPDDKTFKFKEDEES